VSSSSSPNHAAGVNFTNSADSSILSTTLRSLDSIPAASYPPHEPPIKTSVAKLIQRLQEQPIRTSRHDGEHFPVENSLGQTPQTFHMYINGNDGIPLF
jgi:hypothetical protein